MQDETTAKSSNGVSANLRSSLCSNDRFSNLFDTLLEKGCKEMNTDKELCDTCQELLNLLTDGSVGKMMNDNTIESGVTGESEEFVALVTIG